MGGGGGRMGRALRTNAIFGACLLLLGSAAAPPTDPEQTTTEVLVTKPTIVGFFPPVSAEEIETNPGTREGVAHLEFALSDVAKCLKPRDVSVRLELTRVLIFKLGDRQLRFELSPDWQRAVGAYLVEPNREPRVVYASAGPSSLQFLLPNAAAEYFNEPGCKVEL